jgi:hypothetical protein
MLAERVRVRHTAHRMHRRRTVAVGNPTAAVVVKPTAVAVMLVEGTTNNRCCIKRRSFSAPPFCL